MAQPQTDLMRAFEALKNKIYKYDILFRYTEGTQPLIYSTERLEEAFNRINARFNQNWCSVVVYSTTDRINLKGFDVSNNVTANTFLEDFYNRSQMQLDAADAHYAAEVAGESYLIIWKDAEGNIEQYYNDPRMVHMFYKGDNPKEKDFAAKVFVEDDIYKMTLYYPDRLEYYVTNKKDMPDGAKAFTLEDTKTNPYGKIPVFHLRTARVGIKSEVMNIITMQDAINKLIADMMVVAEFGAFKQRYIISDSDTASLKNAPNELWTLPEGSSAGEFSPTDLGGYLNTIDKLANSIAIISRTPKHYFYNVGSAVSGEALLAMEAPLTKKVENRQMNYGVTWREIAGFVLELQGISNFNLTDIIPVWEPAGSIQPLTEAMARKASVDAGVPLKTELRREGWSGQEIEQLDKDIQEKREADASLGRELLNRIRTQQDQSNDDLENGDDNGSTL